MIIESSVVEMYRNSEVWPFGFFCESRGTKLEWLRCMEFFYYLFSIEANFRQSNYFSGDAVGSIAASQLHGSRFHPELVLLTMWSFCGWSHV